MMYFYVSANGSEEELVKVTSNHFIKWKVLNEYRKKAKEEHKTYKVRVRETRELIYM